MMRVLPTLFIASTLDKASMNMARALLRYNERSEVMPGIWRFMGRECISLRAESTGANMRRSIEASTSAVIDESVRSSGDKETDGSDTGNILGVWESISGNASLWI